MTTPTEEIDRLSLYNNSVEANPYTFKGPNGYGYVERWPQALHDVATVANWLADVGVQIGGMETEIVGLYAIIEDLEALADRTDDLAALGGKATEIGALGALTTELAELGAIAAKIETAADNAADIAAVADAITAVNGVYAALSDIAALVPALDDIAALGPRAADIGTLADLEDGTVETGALSTLADLATEIGNVSAAKDDIGTVATAIGDVNTLAGISTAVTAVAAIDSDVTAVAGVSADVELVADNISGILAAKRVTRYLTFAESTSDSDPGNGKFRFSFDVDAATPGSTTGSLYIDLLDKAGTTITTWIEAWDDALNDTARGELTFINVLDPSINVTVQITGAVTTASGYRKVPVKVLAVGGTWTETDFSIDFRAYGNDGEDGEGAGNVNSTGSITSGNLVQYADGSGNVIEDAGIAIANLATHSDIEDHFDTSTDTLDDITEGSTNKHFTATLADKLNAIEASADVTDAGNVGSSIHGASSKTTPVDADTMPLIDSAASNVLKKVSWSNIKATLKTYFDTLYATGSHSHAWSAITSRPDALVSIGGLTPAADRVPYFSGASTAALATLTSFARTLLDDSDASAARTTLGVAIGSDVQEYDADTAKTDVPQLWTATQAADGAALSIASNNVNWTIAGGNFRTLSLTANATLQLPSDLSTAEVGTMITIQIKQDGTGGKTFGVASGITPFNTDTLPDVLDGANQETFATLVVRSSTTMTIAMGGVGEAVS